MKQLDKVKARIKEFILKLNTNKIQGGRIEILNKIAKDINKNQDLNHYPDLLFVCTHNSRRSQFAEIWAKTIAFIYNKKINIFSAGITEENFNWRAINVLQKIGFSITNDSKYHVEFSKNHKPIKMYSKTIDHINSENPLIAVMICAEANADCPNVNTAIKKRLLSYLDPKKWDNTKLEKIKYLETCTMIATEISYLFSKID